MAQVKNTLKHLKEHKSYHLTNNLLKGSKQ